MFNKKLKDYYKKAQKEKWAIPQFNFSSLEQLRGIILAAVKEKSPIILGTSEGECRFFGIEEAVAIVKLFKKRTGLPIFLNLDHGKDFEMIKNAINGGYDAIHFDGSALSSEENIEQTKKVVDYAKRKGVFVEGELGAIKGESNSHTESIEITEKDFTSVADVKNFIKKTGVNSLAIAIGTTHGIYQNETAIDFERLKNIKQEADAFLVLHGGSGVPGEQISKAIDLGINKINFNTELRIAWRKAIEDYLKNNPSEAKPYKILSESINAVANKALEKITLLKSAGKA
jgi:fructose-bisphosphate aldolase, class II